LTRGGDGSFASRSVVESGSAKWTVCYLDGPAVVSDVVGCVVVVRRLVDVVGLLIIGLWPKEMEGEVEGSWCWEVEVGGSLLVG
jgi:hypothetical protein